ncbi:MAG TPA: ABC transporter ATP-binding protein, partial [Chloroflexi bacterium]|nr:ABC transporter ATP-binding protein [Chloroflexota bacterium]
MSRAIRTEGLTKDFGSQRGLFDLHLEVDEGEVLGYLGP